MGLLRKKVPDEGASTTKKEFDNVRGLRFCELFLIGGNAITKNLRAAIYNTTGLNNAENALNCCPDELVNKLDLAGYKKQFNVLAVYLNKPRFWVYDHLTVPVGPVREFDGLKGYWMGVGVIPKGADPKKPGFLTYRKTPVEKKSELTFRAGTQAFIIDNDEGPWVMKAYRDSYGQTIDSLAALDQRYEKLPTGWTFRTLVLDRDLVIAPGKAGVTSQVFQDEFENTFDWVGDGSSNFLP